MSSSVPPGLVREIWLAVAVLIPVAVGLTVAMQSPSGRREGVVKSILRGFPITVGLAIAFLILLLTVPALRLASMARGHQDVYVPLVTTSESYPVATKVILEALAQHGFAMAPMTPPWWAAMPAQILQRMGQGAFTGYVADSSAYFQSGELEGVLYPNALLLRGPSGIATRAHALLVEALTGHPDMFQTATADAQEIERQIQRVWSTYRLDPVAHANRRRSCPASTRSSPRSGAGPSPSTTGRWSIGKRCSSVAPSADVHRSSRSRSRRRMPWLQRRRT